MDAVRSPRALASHRAPLSFGALILAASACRIDQLERSASLAEASAQLGITQQPGAPAPLVLAQIALSEFAVDHFLVLEVTLQITSGQSLEARGIAPEWLGAEAAPPRADFSGPLANLLEAHPRLDAPPCGSAEGCLVTLELTPRGEWASDVPFPLQYSVHATLGLEPRDRMALPSDVGLSLELLP